MVVSIDDLRQAISRATQACIEAKDLFTDIDNISGDGDLGISMEKGALAIERVLQEDINDISTLLGRCAISLNRDAPSTMGTLTSLALMEISRTTQGKEVLTPEDILKIPETSARTIMAFGRACEGDKTVLDALLPLSNSLRENYQKCADIEQVFRSAVNDTILAVSGTKGWTARIGRAKWFASRSRNCQDGGATVYAIVVNALARFPREGLLEDYQKNYCTLQPSLMRPQPQIQENAWGDEQSSLLVAFQLNNGLY